MGTDRLLSRRVNPAWTRDRQVAADYVIANFEQVVPILGVSESNPAESRVRRQANRFARTVVRSYTQPKFFMAYRC